MVKGASPPAGSVRNDPFTAQGTDDNASRERSMNASTMAPFHLPAPRQARQNVSAIPASAPDDSSMPAAGTLPPIIAVQPNPGNFGSTQSTQNRQAPMDSTNSYVPSSNPAEIPPGTKPYIHITVGSAPASSTTATANSSAQTSDGGQLSLGRHLLETNRYADAVDAYKKALASGANNAEAYQGLAQSYQRMNQTSAARNAFSDALQAYEAQAKAGRNIAAAQRGIAVCKSALEMLASE
jgi:tetratricopeptide (TPR) repeat protein